MFDKIGGVEGLLNNIFHLLNPATAFYYKGLYVQNLKSFEEEV